MHKATVRVINERTIEFPYKRRGRIVGKDHRIVNDGYQVQCECGWKSAQTTSVALAKAQLVGHAEVY